MHRQTADGEWRLEPTEGVAVLSSHRALVAAALADVKYDKIAVVREVRHVCTGPLNPIPGAVRRCARAWLSSTCKAVCEHRTEVNLFQAA